LHRCPPPRCCRVPQVVEPEAGRQPGPFDRHRPHRREVRPALSRSMRPTNTRREPDFSEYSARRARSTGITPAGRATVRTPALDFGGPTVMRPPSSETDRATGTRGRRGRGRPESGPPARPTAGLTKPPAARAAASACSGQAGSLPPRFDRPWPVAESSVVPLGPELVDGVAPTLG
jgi:hypothetical protein